MLRMLILLTTFLLTIFQLAFSEIENPKSLSTLFSKIPGTPRIAVNEADQEWLVVWRQGTPGKIMGRIINSNGVPGPSKTLLTGISSSDHSLDVAFNPIDSKYLLTFESERGLEVQLLDANISKQGSPILIEPALRQSHVRVAYDPQENRFLLFWLQNQNLNANVLKILVLDSSAHAINSPKVVAEAGHANHFTALSVARNQKNGTFMVLMSEKTPNLHGSVIGYMVRADGSPLAPKSTLFQGYTASLDTFPQGTFSGSGKGLALWSNSNQLKSRIITDKGKAGAAKTITTAAGSISPQPAIAYDSQKNEFIALWAEQKMIKGARLNSTTGLPLEFFDVAESILNNILNVALAYNAANGNFFAVWEDSTQDHTNPGVPLSKFRIRGGVLGSDSEVIISGEPRLWVPSSVTVRVGTTVKWINNTGDHLITVTSGVPSTSNAGDLFDQHLNPGEFFRYRFTEVGTYQYFCRMAPTDMTGVVNVVR